MDGLFTLGLIVAGLALIDLLAARFGVDSTATGSDPRAPATPWI
jgi:hypothetical protein